MQARAGSEVSAGAGCPSDAWQRVIEDTLRRLGQALGASPDELESLTSLVVSELHLSLGGLIRGT